MSQTDTLLGLLERWVGGLCGQELVEWGVGYRYSARIGELRDQGYTISKTVCQVHSHRSRMYQYTLKERVR